MSLIIPTTPIIDADVLIAAANSSSREKSAARYICSGVNDQDIINSALANNHRVQLASGTFSPSDSIILPTKALFGGMGQNTIIGEKTVITLWPTNRKRPTD